MVAITVILAAVIAAFVFGMAGTSTTSKSVGVTAKYQTSPTAIVFTYNGGADDVKLVYLKFNVNGDIGYSSTTAGSITCNNVNNAGKPSVGDKFYAYTTGTVAFTVNAAGTNKVTVTGKFNDGSEQVLLDTTV